MLRDFFKNLSKGRLFRHPIHAMLVHFPAALFPTSFLFDVLGYVLNENLWSIIAFYTLMLGLLSGILASLFGMIDYFRLPPVHHAWKKATSHAFLNIVWIFALGILWGIKAGNLPDIAIATGFQISIFGFCILGLIYSNFLGGELVFRHKLGTFENG